MSSIGFQSYSWKGEPIADIHAWARERKEQMVEVRFIPGLRPNLVTGRLTRDEPYIQVMPESFWNNFHLPSTMNIEKTEVIRRYDP